jgi:hypothetical protein
MGWKKKRGKDGDWYVVKGTRRGVELPSNRDRRPTEATGSGTFVEPRPTEGGGGMWKKKQARHGRGVELSSNRDRRPTDERRRGVELPSNRDRRPTDGRRRGVELPSNRDRPTPTDERPTDRPTNDDDDGEWNFRRTAPTPNDVRRTSMPKMPSDRAAGLRAHPFRLTPRNG